MSEFFETALQLFFLLKISVKRFLIVKGLNLGEHFHMIEPGMDRTLELNRLCQSTKITCSVSQRKLLANYEMTSSNKSFFIFLQINQTINDIHSNVRHKAKITDQSFSSLVDLFLQMSAAFF